MAWEDQAADPLSKAKNLWKSPILSCTAVAMGDEMDFMFLSLPLGGFQKLLSGTLPLRGGGDPLFPLRVFGQDDLQLRGEGVPPDSAKENSA